MVKQAYDYEQMRNDTEITTLSSIKALVKQHNKEEIIKIKSKELKTIIDQIFSLKWQPKVDACNKGNTYRLVKNKLQYVF